MKKSNKITFFYVISSVCLFLVLLLGGVYGVYVSVGLNFVSGASPNMVENEGVSNVSFGGNINYSPSMTGVIFLSIILVIISIFDFITLIKQVIFFKQFKAVKNSKATKKIERKIPSKGSVIFWTFFIDIVSFIVGIVGLFINNRSFAFGGDMGWLFYLIDSLVSVLSLLSIILLISKLKSKAISKSKTADNRSKQKSNNQYNLKTASIKDGLDSKEINQMEYNLLKLDSMKKNKIVTEDEYKKLRRKILDLKKPERIFEESKQDYWF